MCLKTQNSKNFPTHFFGLCLHWMLFNTVIIYQRFHNLSLFASWNAVFVCLLWKKKKIQSRRSGPRMTGIMLKWPSSKKCHQKAHSALLLMEIRLLTSFPFKIFSYHKKREKGQKTADKRTQMQRLHFSLEDVKISVLKKIKGSTLNAERCLKCRHCSVLEKRT